MNETRIIVANVDPSPTEETPLIAPTMNFDPDQPRDDSGKWTSSGALHPEALRKDYEAKKREADHAYRQASQESAYASKDALHREYTKLHHEADLLRKLHEVAISTGMSNSTSPAARLAFAKGLEARAKKDDAEAADYQSLGEMDRADQIRAQAESLRAMAADVRYPSGKGFGRAGVIRAWESKNPIGPNSPGAAEMLGAGRGRTKR